MVALEAACFGIIALAMVGEELLSKPFWLSWILLNWVVGNASSAEEPLAKAVTVRSERDDLAAAKIRLKLG